MTVHIPAKSEEMVKQTQCQGEVLGRGEVRGQGGRQREKQRFLQRLK